MDQRELRDNQRRSSELYSFEEHLNRGHRGHGAHIHAPVHSGEVTVTNFVREENGDLREVKRTLGRER